MKPTAERWIGRGVVLAWVACVLTMLYWTTLAFGIAAAAMILLTIAFEVVVYYPEDPHANA